MNHSQGTQVQKWSKSVSITVACLVILVHIASTVLVLIYCPELLESESYEGVHCETSYERLNSSCDNEDGCENHGCVVKSDGEAVSLSDVILSYKFPHKPKFSYWSWKMTASLGIYIKVYDNEILSRQSNKTVAPDFNQFVSISGSIDYALNKNLEEADKDNSIPSSAWHSMARAKNMNRSLECHLMHGPDLFDDELNDSDGHKVEEEFSFLCTLIPTLEVFPLSNSTYIVSIHLNSMEIADDTIDLMNTNATIASLLTVVSESDLFHQLKFYMKCTFSPIILFCLIWFLVRLCFNDLYVNIPDRLIITAAVVQILANIPTELIFSQLSLPYMFLVDPVSQVITLTVLATFWIIFTLDKLADNEPWERHTKYYWKTLFCILLGGTVALLTVIYLNFPFLANPFNNHWQPGATMIVSLSLIFSLVIGVAAFQTYLAIIIFKVICDISIHYPTTSRAWRLKLVLLYNLSVSLVCCLGFLFTLVLQMVLHWNPRAPSQPLPFGISTAGSLLLVQELAVNLHIVFLLLALSRSSNPGEGWYAPVRPVIYSPQHREEQLHLWDLSAHPGPLDKLVR